MEINDPADLNNSAEFIESLAPIFEQYRNEYTLYYTQYANDQSPKIRDSNPVIILVPGIGMYAFAKNKQTARVAAEFYINAINVMRVLKPFQNMYHCLGKKPLKSNIGCLKKPNFKDSQRKNP